MLLKRVGLPVLVVFASVLLTLAASRLPSEEVAFAATAGDVTLSAPLQVPVSIHGIAPGDSGSAGAFRIGYEGNVPAWVGLDADLIGPLAGGTSPISITISDGTGRHLVRGENQVLGLFQPGEQMNLAVAYSFPREAGNTYQAQDANLVLQVHAVDWTENTRYENGKPIGPVTWSGRTAGTAVAAKENTETAPTTEPCVGEGCAPAMGSQTVPPVIAQPVTLPAAATPVAAACCQCVRSLLWFGLLYALLLILAMLAAFYAGWHLRERRIRQRLRAIRRTGGNSTKQPSP